MNIQHLLHELKQAGLTDGEIGRRIKAPQATVTRLRNGTHKTCSYPRGLAIARLVEKVRKEGP